MRLFLRLLFLSLLVGAIGLLNLDLTNRQTQESDRAVPTALHEPLRKSEQLARIQAFLDRHPLPLKESEVRELSLSICRFSEKYDLGVDTIIAVIQTESDFDRWAVSTKGAVGLMQILPTTGKALASELQLPWTGIDLLNDPHVNIELGTYYLSSLLDRFDNLETALLAYNMGPTLIDDLLHRETELPRRYPQRVNQYRRSYQSFGQSHGGLP